MSKPKTLLSVFAGIILIVFIFLWTKGLVFQIGPNLFSQDQDFGIVELVVQDGKVLFVKVRGLANRTTNELITEATNFNLASLSKQFTAMTAYLLMQKGFFSLDDSIVKFLPELPIIYSSIKVKNLIFHTSGLPDYMPICLYGTKKIQNQNVLEYVAKINKLNFEPGSKFKYSNTGYVLLSEILQRASRKNFPQLLRELIFSPLHMDQSDVFNSDSENTIRNKVVGYSGWPHFNVLDDSTCNYTYGDGGIYTSLNDYRKWLEALSADEWLSAQAKKDIFTSGKLNNDKSTHYSYGWVISYVPGQKFFMHSGSWMGHRSGVYFYPEKKLFSIVFSNSAGVDAWKLAKENAEKFLY